MRLELADVSKAYPGVQALSHVSIGVAAGEIHGLVGENGAGKSTLMAIASGALIPDTGTVCVDGTPLGSGGPAGARARGVAIVRQEPSLMPHLTVAENLYLSCTREHRPPHPVRLRKWVETENVTTTVPVRKEKIQLETEPPPEGRIESVKDAGEDSRGDHPSV